METKKVTILIATYNSKPLLQKVFGAIKKQTYPQSLISVIAIDGGSNDDTIDYVRENGYTVIDNPRSEPVYAKYLGYLSANSDYAIYLDHDEVIENPRSIEAKVALFESDYKVKAVLSSGYKTPKGISFINDYINEFGDPFSAFIYRLSKMDHLFLESMKRKYQVVKENSKGITFKFNKNNNLPIIELVATGSMIDLKFFKDHFPDTLNSPNMLPHFFYMLVEKKQHIAIAKNDALYHYSSDTFWKYLSKIKWRIKNNIFFPHMAKSGFKGREQYGSEMIKYKKYFFIPFSLSVVLPLLDSFFLVISRRKLSYLIHFPLSIFTASYIIGYYVMKLFGYNPPMKSYDEEKIIKRL